MADFHDRRGGGKVYTFTPAGDDIWRDRSAPGRAGSISAGDPVRMSKKHGLGRNAQVPKSYAYVEHAETGEFHGLVNRASLTPRKKS